MVDIIRNAAYNMEFRQKSYNASIGELSPETAIHPSFRDQLIVKECQYGSLLSSPTFHITTKDGWFTTKQILTSGIIYSTLLVDYEELFNTTDVILTIRGEQRLENGVTTLTAYTTLIITIIDVDDMNPVFTEDVYHLNVLEETPGGSGNPYKTSPPIHAYDGDRGINETMIYSIENEMNNTFSINTMSGEIYVLKELDADGGLDLYVIIIKATQQSNTFRSATSTLSLRVIDINDNPPIFSPNNYYCNVTEHSAVGQVICSVTATDKDKGQNGQFSYELLNGNAVDIDPISGYIHVKDSHLLDRETGSHLFMKVIAKSSDGNMTDKANVTINLIDINDNSPVTNQSSYHFIVQNTSIGSYVGKINAFDMDSGDNQKLNYSWGTCLSNIGVCIGNNTICHFPFIIDAESGTIAMNGCTAECILSTLVSVCDSSHYFQRYECYELSDGFDLINGHCVKRTSVQNEPETVSTVLIVSTVLGSTVAVIVVGVIVYYWFILRRRRAKSHKETKETVLTESQEMESRKENHSNTEEIYDVITDLPDDYLTPQNSIPTVGDSDDRVGSYEKLRNANQNMSEGYSYLNTLTSNEHESNSRKYENTKHITPTGETNMHPKPDDVHTSTD
ncbi:hypothetical protein ACJMK2_029693 [Sinanodonta woodiana]|uniref:Cadherin domain-containing protein n=1 Tax=Sinanodonta woodiana TaxID=1069815 RepID=A0ABD3XBF4_SINWO